ncbi:hypothetical protein D3C87_1355000 [compost metagenome]
MGFFDSLGRMFKGEPIFVDESKKDGQNDDNDDPWRQDDPAEESQEAPMKSLLVDEKGRKIIPEIRLEHCKSHVNGSIMTVTAWATNTGDVEVELDKIEILGMRYEIDRFLNPGKSHEITIYKGPAPTNDAHHEAILHYRIVKNGDYFAAEFMVEYNRESSGIFIVEELHPESVIRDV